MRELSALDYGDVWVPKNETEAIVGRQVAPRSYEIVTSNGAATHRNRQDMILTPSSTDASTSSRNKLENHYPPTTLLYEGAHECLALQLVYSQLEITKSPL